MIYRTIIFLTTFATVCNSQFVGQGACPQTTPMANFNQSSFTGKWYTILQYPNILYELAICPSISYGLNADGTYAIIQNQIPFLDQPSSVNGVGKFSDNTIGSWQWSPDINTAGGSTYTVLATDYDSYATIFSCQSFGNAFYLGFLWILTKRYPLTVPQSARQAGIDAAANAGLNTAYLLPVIQICTIPSLQDIQQLLGWG